MKHSSYCLFETSLGPCGIAWIEGDPSISTPAVAFFQLPEASANLTRMRMERLCGAREPAIPPAAIAGVIEKVRQHLDGTPQDFRDVSLDLQGVGTFSRRVYELAQSIPAGEVRTYGEIAKALNQPGATRAVGQALGHNPIPLIIPCHRILAAGGKAGGFSAPGGTTTKARLLAMEGVMLEPPSPAKLQRTLWEPTRP
jgi:O-6-methylguanine DNA methyltransferase